VEAVDATDPPSRRRTAITLRPPEMAAMLFARGPESIRIARGEGTKNCVLMVRGPGANVVTHEFTDVTDCIRRQAEIELSLISEGYRFISDRRKGGTWQGADRRRVMD
jgi:hypothetical protein